MLKQEFLHLARRYPVAAAIKTYEDGLEALEAEVALLFLLKGNAFDMQPFIEEAHRKGKGIVIHIDLIGGVGKDRAGIQYLHRIGADAIVTSKSQLVAAGKAEGLVTIQRLLLLEDSALDKGVKTIAHARPDLVEVLPGIIFADIAPQLQKLLPGPFIAGGFIQSHDEVEQVRRAGAILCTSSTPTLWRRP